jgi:hypothetical protein
MKDCWNNQNNNDYTTRMTKYKFVWPVDTSLRLRVADTGRCEPDTWEF